MTRDWYVVTDWGHPCHGEVECREAHEDRIRREVRDASQTALRPSPN